MQAQQAESFGVVRRALDIEDYIDIARRHRGWILGPAFAALVVSVIGAYLWPDTYRSQGRPCASKVRWHAWTTT